MNRYVNGHAKKHFEESFGLSPKKGEKSEKDKCDHSVCMDCCSYSLFGKFLEHVFVSDYMTLIICNHSLCWVCKGWGVCK